MPAKPRRTSSKERVRAYRERMRAAGMRQVTFWVPDTRTEEFKKEARRQTRAIARSEQERDDLAFIEALGDEAEW